MKVLPLFALGFAAAMGVGALGIAPVWIFVLVAAMAGLLVAALKFRKRWKCFVAVAVACSGWILGSGWYLAFQAVYLTPAEQMDGLQIEAELEAADYAEETQYGSAVDCTMKRSGKTYRIVVYLKSMEAVEPGDKITGEFAFRTTTPGSRLEIRSDQGKGIFLKATQKGNVTIVPGESRTLRHFAADLRLRIRQCLEEAFPEDTAAFAKALLLGDCTDLTYAQETALCISGIRHVVAVSGLHVSILYGLVQVVTLKKRWLTVLLGLPVLLLFAAVAGFSPSVNRAAIMIGLMILALALNREYDPPSALGFSVVCMLAVNPLTVVSVGWQLSVASVSGIFLFQKPIQNWLRRFYTGKTGFPAKIGNFVSSSVSISLSTAILTTPLSAWYFGTVSLISPLTNLLTLWAVSVVFYGILLVCLVSIIWAVGGAWIAGSVAWLIRYILTVAETLAQFPFAAVYTQSPYIVVWLVFVYLLLVAFLLERKKKPVLLGLFAAVGLAVAMLPGWLEPLTDECRVTVLDVGQGQSILLQSQGYTFLVDCGGDRDDSTADLVAETLMSQGIFRLDGIVLTHYDRDHAGGLPNLLTRMDAGVLLLPPEESEIMEGVLTSSHGQAVYVEQDMEIAAEGWKLTVFAPPFSFESNENSLCVLFQTENCDILITGDRSGFGERQLLRHTELPELELLIVGHHGSRYSTCEELLEATRPENAIISVGEDNSYGHPAQEVLDRLEEYGCIVYRTDRDGTVIFRR